MLLPAFIYKLNSTGHSLKPFLPAVEVFDLFSGEHGFYKSFLSQALLRLSAVSPVPQKIVMNEDIFWRFDSSFMLFNLLQNLAGIVIFRVQFEGYASGAG